MDLDSRQTYLAGMHLVTVLEQDREGMGARLDKQEMGIAISAQASGKTLGTDGLPPERYQRFARLLVTKIVELYTEAYEMGELPPLTRKALVIPLPKGKRADMTVADYCPLFMLNTNIKVLRRALTTKLLHHMQMLIHTDQNGFIPTHSTSHNLQRLYSLLYEDPQHLGLRVQCATLVRPQYHRQPNSEEG
ncbi:hypothetical protein NDU88_003552 [Pleurodeles waltl]|uniref:Reverse transcriptase domain-containing protein n=1 Tax=Pleurodeles waltl TaxID=8319 RepID=A0AAV7MSS4_PLEWA|nr:hypothetical protein NDU88_003552 [Pleurodeles waltl]